jgi:hypothetical protein
VQVAELDRGEDRGTDHRGGADGEGRMQALGEGLAGRPQQHLPELVGELPGCCHRAAEGIPRGRCGLGRDPGRQGVVGQPAAVDAGADDTQDRDAQRPAELGAGL